MIDVTAVMQCDGAGVYRWVDNRRVYLCAYVAECLFPGIGPDFVGNKIRVRVTNGAHKGSRRCVMLPCSLKMYYMVSGRQIYLLPRTRDWLTERGIDLAKPFWASLKKEPAEEETIPCG